MVKIGVSKMEDEKPGSTFKTFEEREEQFWTIVDNVQGAPRPGYAEALLIRGNERLKRAIELNLEAIEKLRISTEESSCQANRLSKVIKNLTWALVGLTAAAVVLTAISLYVLFNSPK
jgi:hypothetical protein